MNNNYIIKQYSQYDFGVTTEASEATSVTLIMRNQDTDVTYSVTASYTDGEAQLTLDSEQTSVIGVYDYQLQDNIPGEDPIIYPPSDCEGDCGFGTITICESLVVS